MIKRDSDILIVGGGAAGLAAALAASRKGDRAVTIIDDNPQLGGQIWRARLGKIDSPDARKLIDAIRFNRIKIVNNAQVFTAVDRQTLTAETPAGPVRFGYRKLIIATGARERFLPFPGWTLPNVSGAGGLQALAKGGLKVENKRIVVAGTGPLLLAVADYLRSKGALIAAIVEQAPAAKINRFALGLWHSPGKIAEAIALKQRLLGIPYLTNGWVTSASGTEKLESVSLVRNGKAQTIECDHLACGFHLAPNLELAAILGCKLEAGLVAVDEFQATTCENIYCAGEPTGIAGVESSLAEGAIAGFAASGETDAAKQLFGKRDRAARFGIELNKAFTLREELKTLSDDRTMVCRCEDVQYGRLVEFRSFRDAKLQTRCGMGPCQGRICGAATEFLFGWEPGSVRPPIFPVRMEHL